MENRILLTFIFPSPKWPFSANKMRTFKLYTVDIMPNLLTLATAHSSNRESTPRPHFISDDELEKHQ
jgi:hypothetical protein